jgi:hypothetical protein
VLRPTVARVVWSSAISEPCLFAAVVRAQGQRSVSLPRRVKRLRKKLKTTLCGRAASARTPGPESSKANAGTTDMAGSLRVVIALPLQCCSAEAGAEWLADAGCGRGSRIFRSWVRPKRRAHHDEAAPRLSSVSLEVAVASVGLALLRTHALRAHSTLHAGRPRSPPSCSPAAVAHDTLRPPEASRLLCTPSLSSQFALRACRDACSPR